jgi:hypothetical protein
MNIIGECMICGKRPGLFTCKSCGMSVCEHCFERTTAVCIDCASLINNVDED